MQKKLEKLKIILEEKYKDAECILEMDSEIETQEKPHLKAAKDLAKIKHAFRGAALTLLGYKILEPKQDIRAHKDEYEKGFSARTYDTRVTVPFLIEKSLPRSVESHWLTQTLSFAGVLTEDQVLKTQPKKSGPLLIEVVNYAQTTSEEIGKMITVILLELIKIRNKDKVILTKPKSLPIDTVKLILNKHFNIKYKNNAPRLPQLAIYAIYQSIIGKMARFNNQSLEPIQRMKSADRKAGTVGDIVLVNEENQPVEAVEIKFGQPISDIHVCEAIEKVRGVSVSRYYMLSTNGAVEEDIEIINERKAEFLKQNGCEIIVNGIVETIGYYLRLLPSTTEFLANYANLVEVDSDTSYEHRIAWNEVCSKI
ncbi:MAG: hypothetical protein OXE99_13685 [Cellvibrionales bacterium]|nr:hypothetical protein [Cellvibrionales bacterium]